MRRWSSKEEADWLKQVSVYFLKENGYFRNCWMSGTVTWSRDGEKTGSISLQSNINDHEKYVRFIYTQTNRDTGEKQSLDYKIPLVATPCHFGGFRYWFQCPWYVNGVCCGRRVGVLHLGDKYFACRHCNNLTYESRNVSGTQKACGRIISEPEIESMKNDVKRLLYRGKPTRKFLRYLKMQNKAKMAFESAVMLLSSRKMGHL